MLSQGARKAMHRIVERVFLEKFFVGNFCDFGSESRDSRRLLDRGRRTSRVRTEFCCNQEMSAPQWFLELLTRYCRRFLCEGLRAAASASTHRIERTA
jgi:hypothetical protein